MGQFEFVNRTTNRCWNKIVDEEELDIVESNMGTADFPLML